MAEHGDWATYSYQAQNGKVCYVLTVPKPKSMQPPTLDHGDMFFFAASAPDRPSPSSRSSLPATTQGRLEGLGTIGNKKFSMFTKGKSAWVENAAEEPLLIAAMKSGTT